jgi:hypothetical protein
MIPTLFHLMCSFEHVLFHWKTRIAHFAAGWCERPKVYILSHWIFIYFCVYLTQSISPNFLRELTSRTDVKLFNRVEQFAIYILFFNFHHYFNFKASGTETDVKKTIKYCISFVCGIVLWGGDGSPSSWTAKISVYQSDAIQFSIF